MINGATNLELRLVQPEKNKARLYGMHEVRSLFGDTCLVIAWGRIGSRLRRREETFASRRELARRWNELLGVRRRHGYPVPEGASIEIDNAADAE